MLTEYQPSSAFHNAASHLSSASSLNKVSTSVKLELYGLFKYLTVAKSPNTSRPSLFDMTGRAKWDAWAAASKKHENPANAELRYLEIATNLGWNESESSKDEEAPQQAIKAGKKDVDEIDLDNLSDDEDETPGNASASGGLGVVVSTLNQVDGVEQPMDHSLHGLAVSGELTGLKLLLDSSKNLDLNAPDEYGYAPLHLACDRGHVEVVKLLLAQGANKEVKDPDGLTPLELSQEAGRMDIAEILAI
ncbi:ankyrin repeat-containing domain protein [Crepidotus variabilis]|uniref:Ankyrin repeat-containing domain protein n=1 Tax=Crepidotus variabilis TaxID=179855 RepID=A0A9P6ESK2_9AGAR|nr:ankyrin repeat-containing domain protein [Crepidotus variabilis]